MLDVLLLVQEKELQTKADQIIEDELQSKCCIMDYHTYVCIRDTVPSGTWHHGRLVCTS